MPVKKLKKDLATIDAATKLTIIVAALGYMVDIFDLLLFSIVRISSLKDLGLEGDELLSKGILLINAQMAGLLIGGILWGVWGDKMGRVSVLFGSILLYSVANIANGFVTDVNQYAVLRLIAGVGLAGELGAGVTLASELFPKNWRGMGTTFIASVGMIGAVLAALIADYADWRTAYMVGGLMGLTLLIMRMRLKESGLYQEVKSKKKVKRGNFLMLFSTRDRIMRYLKTIIIGAPIWGVVGLFITFTPEFAKDFGMSEIPTAGLAVLFCYSGLLVGDIISGTLSQLLQSRRQSVMIMLGVMVAAIALYILLPGKTLHVYYMLCFLMGLGCGYWAMFIQIGAEQFGTNIRATAATTVPNMVRGLTIPMTAGFHFLIPTLGVTGAGVAVIAVTIILAFVSVLTLHETFDKNLDFVER